jgi:hypothetical protein
MPRLTKHRAIEAVETMLTSYLPKTWHAHVKLAPYATDLPGIEVDGHDLVWLIRRPEHADDGLKYYRLKLVGNSGRLFLITYGNTDAGVGPNFEHAILFWEDRAKSTLNQIVVEPDEFPPNHYGFT